MHLHHCPTAQQQAQSLLIHFEYWAKLRRIHDEI
jgi:hypothetical protein